MMELFWTEEACGDLCEIRDHAAEGSPRTPAQVGKAIREQIVTLKLHPFIGRPSIVEGTRELIIHDPSCLAVYRVKRGAVEVLALVPIQDRPAFVEALPCFGTGGAPEPDHPMVVDFADGYTGSAP